MIQTKQFQSDRGCLSYIVYDTESKQALLIDPTTELEDTVYLSFLSSNDLDLQYIVETHTHADHVTSNIQIREKTGAPIVMHELSPTPRKDIAVSDGYELHLGTETVVIYETPGHTNEHIALYTNGMVFTGDTLLIEGTGRTDFQLGNSSDLYESLWQKIVALGDDVIVYPGHDYKGRDASTVQSEKEHNPRLQLQKDEFIQHMDAHHPELPELFEESIEKNTA